MRFILRSRVLHTLMVHFLVAKFIHETKIKVSYLLTGEWRVLTGCKMNKEEVVRYTQEELDYFQPEITKEMRGLNIKEKQEILRRCLKEHLKITKAIKKLKPDQKFEILKNHT